MVLTVFFCDKNGKKVGVSRKYDYNICGFAHWRDVFDCCDIERAPWFNYMAFEPDRVAILKQLSLPYSWSVNLSPTQLREQHNSLDRIYDNYQGEEKAQLFSIMGLLMQAILRGCGTLAEQVERDEKLPPCSDKQQQGE
jgi:hypothetical protein